MQYVSLKIYKYTKTIFKIKGGDLLCPMNQILKKLRPSAMFPLIRMCYGIKWLIVIILLMHHVVCVSKQVSKQVCVFGWAAFGSKKSAINIVSLELDISGFFYINSRKILNILKETRDFLLWWRGILGLRGSGCAQEAQLCMPSWYPESYGILW